LPDSVANRNVAILKFNDCDRDAVDIEHKVRPALIIAPQGNFLSDGEIVLLWLGPIYEVDLYIRLASLSLHVHAVAKQTVNGFVIFVETAVRSIGF
jgi:hypothetical protein